MTVPPPFHPPRRRERRGHCHHQPQRAHLRQDQGPPASPSLQPDHPPRRRERRGHRHHQPLRRVRHHSRQPPSQHRRQHSRGGQGGPRGLGGPPERNPCLSGPG